MARIQADPPRWHILLGATLLAFASCSSSAPMKQSSNDGIEVSVGTDHATEIEVSSQEKLLIGDGDASEADLDQALSAVVECLVQKGFVGSSYAFSPPWTQSVNVLGPTIAGSDAALQECNARYLDAVSAMFFEQHGPTADQKAEADRLTVACLVDHGQHVASGQSDADAMAAADQGQLTSCVALARDKVK